MLPDHPHNTGHDDESGVAQRRHELPGVACLGLTHGDDASGVDAGEQTDLMRRGHDRQQDRDRGHAKETDDPQGSPVLRIKARAREPGGPARRRRQLRDVAGHRSPPPLSPVPSGHEIQAQHQRPQQQTAIAPLVR
jgi:hypothetical protein